MEGLCLCVSVCVCVFVRACVWLLSIYFDTVYTYIWRMYYIRIHVYMTYI
jgi:hypothetical protein